MPAHVLDVFVYVVVLNLAVEYVPSVISESFTMSLVTALLLKAVLEVVVALKNRAKSRFKGAESPVGKAGALVLLWLLLVGSKFVVLELTDLIPGVSLGGFWAVTGLILVLMATRAAARRVLARTSSTPTPV